MRTIRLCQFVAALFIAVSIGNVPVAAEEQARKAIDAMDSTADPAIKELTAQLHYFLANSSSEDAHAQFWADDLVYTSSNGTRFGKDDIMQGFAEPEESAEEASDEPNVVYTGEDVNVQVFGTTAVVTFKLVGTPDDGSSGQKYFNSGTFVKRHGAWRVVVWQATIIPAES
ncbi:MAG: nuclear transport factor 2 family protein [Woeseiaceae bacterium]